MSQVSVSPVNPTVTEVTVSCQPHQAEHLTELLWTLPGVQSVSQALAGNAPGEEAPYAVSVIATEMSLAELHAAVEALLAQDNALQTPLLADCQILRTRNIAPEDWAESWKQFWHVQSIVPGRLVVCPSWEEYRSETSNPNEVVLRLDPGSAFGTGTHETTRLMLGQMAVLAETLDFSNLNVLDVGTGSGILALYAAKLGSRSVRGIDTDPVAVVAAQQNATLNGLSDRLNFSDTALEDLCRTPVDLMLANIIAPVILELLPAMVERLAPEGQLLLSGLIAKNLPDIEAALAQNGLQIIKTCQQGDWFLLQSSQ